MQSRNKREGYYFGFSYSWREDKDKLLKNGFMVDKRGPKKHKRTKLQWLSLKGYFKGMNK